MTRNDTPPIDSLAFEDAIRELESIVRTLESGEGGLEQAIDEYARGTALKEHCEQKLKSARMKVEKIMKTADGRTAAEPFEAD